MNGEQPTGNNKRAAVEPPGNGLEKPQKKSLAATESAMAAVERAAEGSEGPGDPSKKPNSPE